mmetsp:Transcript_18254/g.46224  ORF Transcript_18254/g.46224 Transcript_18254/m.46224 type:complete len:212 (+) Transcript_18254:492-1127(+)
MSDACRTATRRATTAGPTRCCCRRCPSPRDRYTPSTTPSTQTTRTPPSRRQKRMTPLSRPCRTASCPAPAASPPSTCCYWALGRTATSAPSSQGTLCSQWRTSAGSCPSRTPPSRRPSASPSPCRSSTPPPTRALWHAAAARRRWRTSSWTRSPSRAPSPRRWSSWSAASLSSGSWTRRARRRSLRPSPSCSRELVPPQRKLKWKNRRTAC